MGYSKDYSDVPDWQEKPEGYKTGARVKYQGNIFEAAFWASEPGKGDPSENGWRLYDELYDLTSSRKTERVNIIGYIPTWRGSEDFDHTNKEIYRYITHGIIAFLMFSESNLGEFEPKALDSVNSMVSDVVSVGHAVGTKILIALGGATDYGFLYLMERIGNNPADPLLNQTVEKVVSFVESNGLDGVDLDLECWWDKNSDPNKDQGGRQKSQGSHLAARGLTEFAKRLKQAMPDKIISAALFATSWYGNNYDSKLVDYLDWFAVMTYDLTGSWNDSPVGPHTALYKIREEQQKSYEEEQQGEWPDKGYVDNPIHAVEDSLWYWTNPFFTNWQGEGQKILRSKMAVGVPVYGYDFAYAKDPDDLSGQIAPGYKSIRYKDLLSQFPNAYNDANANIKKSGSTPRPKFRNDQSGNYPYQHNIYFETPKTAVEKLNFLKSVGGGGIIIWELSNDVWDEGRSIVKALYKNSGNPATRPPLPTNIKTSLPSDILKPALERVKSYTDEFAAEIARRQEQRTSKLSLLVEPSLEEPITKFFEEAGKSKGKEIRREDADTLIGWWREIEEGVKRYEAHTPEASNLITEIQSKLDRVVERVESKIQEEDGWLFVPFYSVITVFDAHISMEKLVRQHPRPSLGSDSGSGSSNHSNQQRACERQVGEISGRIQRSIDVLTRAKQKWPQEDLSSVESVLGSTESGTTQEELIDILVPAPNSSSATKKSSYAVVIKTTFSFPIAAITTANFEIAFQDEGRDLARFEGTSTNISNTVAFTEYSWQGIANFNYDVEWLANQGWQANFDFSFGPDGFNMSLRGLSEEEIGYVSSDENNAIFSAGLGDGQGTFYA
jgi:GH18 family chitinase